MFAVIGTGSMGTAIAEGLLSAGREVMVYNRTREKTAPLERLGAGVAESPAQALRSCESAILVLSDAAATREVLLEPTTAAALDGKRLLSVAHSSAAEITELARQVRRHGGRLAEVNVTVYPAAVRARAGHFNLGADEDDAEYWTPVLGALGQHVHVVGAVGKASLTEFALWLSYMFNPIAVAYVAAAFKALGLPDEALVSSLTENPTLRVAGAESYLAQMTSRAYQTDIFSVDNFTHSAALVMREAEELGLPTAPLVAIQELFLTASRSGHGSDDVAAVFEVLGAGALDPGSESLHNRGTRS